MTEVGIMSHLTFWYCYLVC